MLDLNLTRSYLNNFRRGLLEIKGGEDLPGLDSRSQNGHGRVFHCRRGPDLPEGEGSSGGRTGL